MTRRRSLTLIGACRQIAALGAALVLAALTRADLEFTGILVTSQNAIFAVRDTTTAKTEWRAIGERFAGHTLVRFDREKDSLVLSKEGAELVLRLKDDARIKSAQLELRGTLTLGLGRKLEVTRASLRYDEKNIFPLGDGILCEITPKRLPDGNLLFEMAVDRSFPPDIVKRISSPKVVVLPDRPFELRVGELVFAFAPQGG